MTANSQAELTEVQSADSDALTPLKALTLPDSASLSRSALAAQRMADTFVIQTQEDYEMCGEELRGVKGKITALEGKRTAITGPMNAALKAVNDLFRGPMAALVAAETKFKQSMLAYSTEQERLAAEERKRAEKLAAEERQRVEAEARRIEQEATAERQRLAKIETERAAAAQAEQDRLASEAVAAAAAGNQAKAAEAERLANEAFDRDEQAKQQAREEAEQVEQAAEAESAALRITAAVTSAPVVRIAPAKASGISVAKTVDFELVNLLALVKHIAEHPELINLLRHDDVKLRAYVRSLGMNTNLPGVDVFEKRSMSARA
jgi:hypothetical protein